MCHAGLTLTTWPRTSDDHLDEYLSIREAASILHLSPRATRRLVSNGGLPAVKLGDGQSSSLRVPRSGLRHWIAAHTVGAREVR